MSPKVATVFAAAESLSIEERHELIDLLLAGLEELPTSEAGAGPPALSEAWRQEIARRSAEFDTGRAETVVWEEVRARWQSRSGGRSPA